MKTKKSRFKCKDNCCECCGVVPMPKYFFDAHIPQMRRPVKKFMFDNRGRVWSFTFDGMCIYLDSDNRCTIYDERPDVCRRFGCDDDLPCPYVDPSGNVRSPESQKQARAKLEAIVEDAKRRSPPA